MTKMLTEKQSSCDLKLEEKTVTLVFETTSEETAKQIYQQLSSSLFSLLLLKPENIVVDSELPVSPMTHPPLDSFTEAIDKLTDKIKTKYPSLGPVQTYMIATGLINIITKMMDDSYVEKQISNMVSEFNSINE
jgi:hypothetical protein